MIHILFEGLALCGAGVPNSWPSAHRWLPFADYPAEIGKHSFCHGCVEQYQARTIPVAVERGGFGPPHEECCFCFTPTPLWTNLPDRKPGEQVACCLECSQTRKREEVPSKQQWCADAEKRRPAFFKRF